MVSEFQQPELSNIFIKRPTDKMDCGEFMIRNLCSALLEFPDHDAALRAKQKSSTGSLNLWNRTIKVLWARPDVKTTHDQSKLVIHNMPDKADTDDLFRDMCNYIFEHEILSISPLYKFIVSMASRVDFSFEYLKYP